MESRSDQFLYLLVIGVVKVFVIVFAGNLFDHPKVGRRPLLLASNVGCSLSLLVLGINFLTLPAGKDDEDEVDGFEGKDDGNGSTSSSSGQGIAVAALVCYVASFSLGMGPGAWLIPSEVFSNRVRARAMSLATFANRGFAATASMSFLSLRGAIGDAACCFAFACLALGNVLFIALLVPETKHKTLEEMRAYFDTVRFPCEPGSAFRWGKARGWLSAPGRRYSQQQEGDGAALATGSPLGGGSPSSSRPGSGDNCVSANAGDLGISGGSGSGREQGTIEMGTTRNPINSGIAAS